MGNWRAFSLNKMYLLEAKGAILTFDVTNRDSLEMCDKWARELRKEGEPQRAVVAVGNKIDLADHREVSTEEARAHFETMNPSIPYFETSAKTGEGVHELFEAVTRMALEIKRDAAQPSNENTNVPAPEEKQPGKDGGCVIC